MLPSDGRLSLPVLWTFLPAQNLDVPAGIDQLYDHFLPAKLYTCYMWLYRLFSLLGQLHLKLLTEFCVSADYLPVIWCTEFRVYAVTNRSRYMGHRLKSYQMTGLQTVGPPAGHPGPGHEPGRWHPTAGHSVQLTGPYVGGCLTR